MAYQPPRQTTEALGQHFSSSLPPSPVLQSLVRDSYPSQPQPSGCTQTSLGHFIPANSAQALVLLLMTPWVAHPDGGAIATPYLRA